MRRRSTYISTLRTTTYAEHVAAALGALTGALATTLAVVALLIEVAA